MRFFLAQPTTPAGGIEIFYSRPLRMMKESDLECFFNGDRAICVHLLERFLPIDIEKNECIEVEVERSSGTEVTIRTLQRNVFCQTDVV